jgi:hypothetical protein
MRLSLLAAAVLGLAAAHAEGVKIGVLRVVVEH